MGCDCHFYTEKWTSSNDYDGPRDLSEDREQKLNEVLEDIPTKYRWVSADKWVCEDGEWEVPYHSQYYNGRNYYLFSILADVRNDGSVEPISEPRGIPYDASSGYLYMIKRWNGDAHSHSYFTLKELREVDWSKYETQYFDNFINVIGNLSSIDSDPEKVRICFFFDN